MPTPKGDHPHRVRRGCDALRGSGSWCPRRTISSTSSSVKRTVCRGGCAAPDALPLSPAATTAARAAAPPPQRTSAAAHPSRLTPSRSRRRARRRSRRRWSSDRPPHTPYNSPFSIANRRHSRRTGQTAHTRSAGRTVPPWPGKTTPGRRWHSSPNPPNQPATGRRRHQRDPAPRQPATRRPPNDRRDTGALPPRPPVHHGSALEFFEALGIGNRGVLDAAVGMMGEPAVDAVAAAPDGHLECVQSEVGAQVVADLPADDHLGVQVGDEGGVEPAGGVST